MIKVGVIRDGRVEVSRGTRRSAIRSWCAAQDQLVDGVGGLAARRDGRRRAPPASVRPPRRPRPAEPARRRDALRSLDPAPDPHLDDDARVGRVRRARLPAPRRRPVPEHGLPRPHRAGRARRRDARGHGRGRDRRPRGAPQHDRRRALDPLDVVPGRRADRGRVRARQRISTSPPRTCATRSALARVAAAGDARAARWLGPSTRTTRPCCGSRSTAHRSIVETSEIVRRQVNPYLETIPGVAGVAMFGRRDRNIRIWLDGDALRARGLSADRRTAARCSASTSRCRAARSRAAASTTPSRPTPSSAPSRRWRRWSSRTTNGAPVLLRDVARVEDGAEDRVVRSRATTASPPSAWASASRAAATPSRSWTRCDRDSATSRRCCPSGIKIYDESGFIDFSQWRARGGGRDRVRAGVRRAARGLHGLGVPAPLAADLHHRRSRFRCR